LIKIPGKKYKSYLDHFIPPLVLARAHLANSARNVADFLKKDLHMNSGMRYLIREFYRAVADEIPVPIPYREILLTSRIMDSIFTQLNQPKVIGESE